MATRPIRRIRELRRWLHGSSDFARVGATERGLPIRAIDALRAAGLSERHVDALIATRRTIARRHARCERLSRDESDRLIRVARTMELSEKMFGTPERSLRWLHQVKRGLRRRSPLDLLVTEAGARLVEEMLARIDEGMSA